MSALQDADHRWHSTRKALVVLSGGQDSSTVLLHAKDSGYAEVHAITFDYGQRHRAELAAAQRIAEMVGVTSHRIVNVRGLLQSTSPLTDPNAELETYDDYDTMDKTIGNRVELTFVPLRNLFFLVAAANHALAVGAYDVFLGVCQMDNANYPDCTNQFKVQAEQTMREALGMNRSDYSGPLLNVHAPLMYRTKAETVNLALQYPQGSAVMAETHTCYAGAVPPCGKCHACVLRAEGFRTAGVVDPLVEKWKNNPHTASSEDRLAAEMKELEGHYRQMRAQVSGTSVVDPYFELIASIQKRINEIARHSAAWNMSPQSALKNVADRLLGERFEYVIGTEGTTEFRLVIVRYIPDLMPQAI